MVTPPTPDEAEYGRLKAGFVLLVGISGGTMAIQGGASLATVALATAGGLVAGGALLWYLLRIAG